ncbi:HepT-like ribonuclease domain-containing protein [Phaeodactylibacter sp.]
MRYRNRIIHEYFGIDIGILWAIIQNNLDHLEKQVANIDIS